MADPRRRPRPRLGPPPAPPPPRQFAQARARASFERILRAALDLYAERGFHDTQTPDIAERAGMSVGGLYRYFGDKNEIFVELMHRVLETNRQRQDAMIDAWEKAWAAGELTAAAMAKTIVEWTFGEILRAPPDLVRTYLAMSYEHEDFAVLREQYDRYERAALARLISKLTPRSRVPSPLAAAKLIDVIVEALAMWSALHPGAGSRGVKKAAIDMLTRYLSPMS